MIDQRVLNQLLESFTKLQAGADGKCSSLLRRHLSWQVFQKLQNRETKSGATLLDVIQSGVLNLDSSIGVYVPDAESYTLFSNLLDPIIEDYHRYSLCRGFQPAQSFGDPQVLTDIDPTGQFIISTRIRCARTLDGYPMHPKMSRSQYEDMEDRIRSVLHRLRGDLSGEYLTLADMDEDTQRRLVDEHLLFRAGDRCLQAANAYRFWPVGRGIYLNRSKTFAVWVNEEDHLRIISISGGSNLRAIYGRLVRGVRAIEANLACTRDDRLGYVTFCPTNLGTTIRASVLIRLTALATRRELLQQLADRYHLQVRGTNGEHSKEIDGVFDISNRRRLGITEHQAVCEMEAGVRKLIEAERSLSSVVAEDAAQSEGFVPIPGAAKAESSE